MLGPWIDDRPAPPRLHHMGAGIPADGTRSDDSYLPTHAFLPAFPTANASAPAELITTDETHRAGCQALFLNVSPFVHRSAKSELELFWRFPTRREHARRRNAAIAIERNVRRGRYQGRFYFVRSDTLPTQNA